ncbi:MAG: MarR family winged helix-turn-helix transcriptional regulator [Pseudomonadota bacterium]
MKKSKAVLRSQSDRFAELDRGLMRLRRMWLQQGRRGRLIDEIGSPIAMSVLRTIFAIDALNSTKTSVSDVAAELEVDASTASRLVESAVSNGYAERTPNAVDRRKSVLKLTTKGRNMLVSARAGREHLLAEVTANWDSDDIETLAALLNRIHDDFEIIDKPAVSKGGE